MAFQFSRKQIQPDTSAPTNRIAAAPVGRLSRWDVVNTITLDEITMQVLIKIKNYEVHNAKTNYIS
ncbi:hypothetical protein [Paenibacillus]|uniref:hypothetical protein n=1 Tax=Paenibacillus TaxID=44249 RepID=UPI000B851EF0|nr:hypothetical protein [Paenibacillus]TDL67673.1 hypothetical protein E2R58_00155 [Paenibacillus amylolyticus]